jgi:beta-glucosidase
MVCQSYLVGGNLDAIWCLNYTDCAHSLQKDYPQCMRDQLGERLPYFSEGDFALLREADCDFYGMNYYTSQFARHKEIPASKDDFIGNVEELQEDKHGNPVGEKSGLQWLRSCPGMFRKHLARVYRLYGKPIYITENGCPCPGEDKMTRDESVEDPYRIRYFDSHLDAICKAINEDGAVVQGYFAWSLLDNLGEFLHGLRCRKDTPRLTRMSRMV